MKNPWSDPARIMSALVLGAMAGALIPATAGICTLTAGAVFAFTGDLFLRLLEMIVVALVATSIITSVARLGLKTLAWYAATTVMPSLVAIVIFNVVSHPRSSRPVAGQCAG